MGLHENSYGLYVFILSYFLQFSQKFIAYLRINNIEGKKFSQRENDEYHDRDLPDVVVVDNDDISIFILTLFSIMCLKH